MNILWGIIGILSLAGFASTAVLVLWANWSSYKFIKLMRRCAKIDGETPSILCVEPRWRRNIAFGSYIFLKHYEHEKWEEVRLAGRRVHKLQAIASILTIATGILFLVIFLVYSRH